ncbi:CG3081, partial [Drosophila busckii]
SGSYKPPDLSYTPGDFTAPEYRLPSHQLLLEQKLDRQLGVERELPLNRLYLQEHESKAGDKYRATAEGAREVSSAVGRQFPSLAAAQARYTGHLNQSSSCESDLLQGDDFGFVPGKDLISLPVLNREPQRDPQREREQKMPLHSITEKPNERCPSPVVPAYANFELAKRMHHDNLDHQPLPDCVADLAYRKAQISGSHGGLALDIDPIATGVGVKTHNAGPTHCTKMKVFRPKTGGVLPKALAGDNYRGVGSAPAKKMGAMDLAIGWDFKPANPADEPRLARHIDGSNDTAGPAVFTCVKTPREEQSNAELGRSAGVFTSTLGEPDFFDKDILRRKTDFAGRPVERNDNCACDYERAPPRARSVSRDSSASHCRRAPAPSAGYGLPSNRMAKQYQSSPMLGDKTYQALREKYLGPDTDDCHGSGLQLGGCHGGGGGGGRGGSPHCKRDQLLRRPARRLCHKVAPAPKCCPSAHGGHGHCLTSKAAFRAGMPKLNASGDFIGVSSPSCGAAGRVLVVPRPRQPYAKKNYDIDTLVPPFRSQGGGAGQGGYPEHWRLASVYQHAYKPVEQRRRPLLQTVYK